MGDIKALLQGFKLFRNQYFVSDRSLYDELSGGQSPKTLVIGCSDSRVDPALLTQAKPGDIFVIRNVANLVPPYEKGGGLHGVSAAIEFAVQDLKVENIIIMGHAQCGGINAMINGTHDHKESFIGKWVSIAKPAKARVLAANPDKSLAELRYEFEKQSVVVSLENLMTFPFIQERVQNGSLEIYGWYFDMQTGHLLIWDAEQGSFQSHFGDLTAPLSSI